MGSAPSSIEQKLSILQERNDRLEQAKVYYGQAERLREKMQQNRDGCWLRHIAVLMAYEKEWTQYKMTRKQKFISQCLRFLLGDTIEIVWEYIQFFPKYDVSTIILEEMEQFSYV